MFLSLAEMGFQKLNAMTKDTMFCPNNVMLLGVTCLGNFKKLFFSFFSILKFCCNWCALLNNERSVFDLQNIPDLLKITQVGTWRS